MNTPLDARGLPPGYPFKPDYEVTPREARDALAVSTPRTILVDVRTTPEVEIASIPGAVHIPLDQIERRADEIDARPGDRVLTLCHHGVRSLKAALALRALGHPDAKSVAGGIELWSLAADASVPRYTRAGAICTRVP